MNGLMTIKFCLLRCAAGLCLTTVCVKAGNTVCWIIPMTFYLGIKDNQYRDYLLLIKNFMENWEEKNLNEDKWKKIQ